MKQTESNKMISKRKIEGCGRETQYVTCDLETIWFGSRTLFSLTDKMRLLWCVLYQLPFRLYDERAEKMQFKEGFNWVHSLKLQSITAKKAWWQRWMHLVTLYPTTIRKKKTKQSNECWLSAGCLFCMQCTFSAMPPTFRLCLPISINLTEKCPQRPDQGFGS